MLHDARMAGLAKLRRSIRSTDERQLWAVHVGRGEIVWQDRCDAANGSKEHKAAAVTKWEVITAESAVRLPILRCLHSPAHTFWKRNVSEKVVDLNY